MHIQSIFMKYSVFVFLIIFCEFISFAQFENQSLFIENDSLSVDNISNPDPLKSDSKLIWNGSVGLSYMFSRNFGSVSALNGSYGFSRPINSKFSFGAGVLVTSYFPATGFINHTESDFQNLSGLSIYGTGSYKLNERLVLYGTGIKHLVEFGADNPFFSYNFNEISFGTSLKLSNTISIGASVHFVDYPVYYSPFFVNGPASSRFSNSW
jgi:hypothetical protein